MDDDDDPFPHDRPMSWAELVVLLTIIVVFGYGLARILVDRGAIVSGP